MGKLLNYDGADKRIRRIADVLNVTDVRRDGNSMVDDNGVVDLSALTSLQDQIDMIIRYLDLDMYYRDENNNIYTDENGSRYSSI